MKEKETNCLPLNQFDESFMANIQGGVITCRFDPDTGKSKVIYMSEGWTNITGYNLEELERDFGGNPQALVLPEDALSAGASYGAQVAMGFSYSLEYRLRHKSGQIIWVLDKGIVVSIENGLNENQSIITDITRVKESEEALRVSEERFRIATKASYATVFEFDVATNTYVHAENAEAVFNVSQEEFIRAVNLAKANKAEFTLQDALGVWFYHEDINMLTSVNEDLFKRGQSECITRVNRKGKIPIWCKLHVAMIYDRDGQAYRVVGHMIDIDEEQKNTQRLQKEAQSDPLTGLYNKIAVRDMLQEVLDTNPQTMRALLLLDVDDFKGVNDHMGHLFGDAVLMDVSNKLKRLFRNDGVVGRVGGDEFAVMLHERFTDDDVVACAAAICSAFRQTYVGEKADYKISCSVGIAYSVEGDTYDTFFHRADTALYQAKGQGKDCYVVYAQENENLVVSNTNMKPADRGDSGRLEIKERIFELLYATNDFSGSVNMILSLLGQMLDMSRVYIFENSEDNCYATNIYEWCADGVIAKQGELKEFPVAELDYFSEFNEAGILDIHDMAILNEPLKTVYERNGACSSYQVALMDDGVVYGFMGYDSVNIIASRTSEEIELMNFAAKITGTFIVKNRADESRKLFDANKIQALNSLPCAIYVIDESYHVQYMNDFVSQIVPEVQHGQKCHEVFMHNNEPCKGCPAVSCKEGPCSAEIYNYTLGIWMIATATKVQWSGRDNMRLLCCQIISQYKQGVPE